MNISLEKSVFDKRYGLLEGKGPHLGYDSIKELSSTHHFKNKVHLIGAVENVEQFNAMLMVNELHDAYLSFDLILSLSIILDYVFAKTLHIYRKDTLSLVLNLSMLIILIATSFPVFLSVARLTTEKLPLPIVDSNL